MVTVFLARSLLAAGVYLMDPFYHHYSPVKRVDPLSCPEMQIIIPFQ